MRNGLSTLALLSTVGCYTGRWQQYLIDNIYANSKPIFLTTYRLL